MTLSSFFVEVGWPAKKFQHILIRVSQDVRISQTTLLLAPSTLFSDPSGVFFFIVCPKEVLKRWHSGVNVFLNSLHKAFV